MCEESGSRGTAGETKTLGALVGVRVEGSQGA